MEGGSCVAVYWKRVPHGRSYNSEAARTVADCSYVLASKSVRGLRWGSLQRSPDPMAGFGEGNMEGTMERVKEGKGTVLGEGKERGGKGKEKGNGIWGGGVWVIGFRGDRRP